MVALLGRGFVWHIVADCMWAFSIFAPKGLCINVMFVAYNATRVMAFLLATAAISTLLMDVVGAMDELI